MKKIMFSILAISALFADTNLEYSKDKAEQSIQKPKVQNMANLLSKEASKLRAKNKEATVYTSSASVDVSPSDPQYYDYLVSAYNQAILQLKADLALQKAGKIAIQESLEFYHKSIPDDLLDKNLKNKVEKRLDELQNSGNISGIFSLIGSVINKIVNNKSDNDKKILRAKAEDIIFNKAYKDGFIKQGVSEIAGLVPYENFIITNEKGEVEIGVLAYTTPKSIQLARDLRQGHNSMKTKNQNQCKNPNEIAQSYTDEELLNKFGLKYFYNQNCRPSLIAFGMDSFIKEDGMNTDYRNESIQRAKGLADKLISNFLSSNVNAFIKNTTLRQKIKKELIQASRQDDNTNYSIQKDKSNGLIKEMAKNFSSKSQMKLIGLEDLRNWSVDKGDYEVDGVIEYYSMDSIIKMRNDFNPPKQTNQQRDTIKNSPSIKSSNNLEVDDF